MKQVYLDYAGTTPLDPRVKEAMEPFWEKEFGNPSSLYPLGKRAKDAIEEARSTIAALIGGRPEEVTFTGGGTEAINLAVFGILEKYSSGHIISTPIEHDAVLEPLRFLGEKGFEVTFVSVDDVGRVRPEEILQSLRPDTLLVAVMYANNEIGTIEPIEEIGKRIKKWKKENGRVPHDPPHLFTDACQAAGFLSLDVEKLGVDLLVFNGSKIYGPKGVGVLWARKGVPLSPRVHGGGQENGLRSGTENIPGIVGLAKAFEIAHKARVRESERLTELRDYFIASLKEAFPEIRLNGDLKERLPNNINVSFPDIEGDAFVIYLGEKGISASTGSACSSVSLEPSHVMEAIKCPNEFLHGTLRFTLGRETRKDDIDYAIEKIREVLDILKKKEK